MVILKYKYIQIKYKLYHRYLYMYMEYILYIDTYVCVRYNAYKNEFNMFETDNTQESLTQGTGRLYWTRNKLKIKTVIR